MMQPMKTESIVEIMLLIYSVIHSAIVVVAVIYATQSDVQLLRWVVFALLPVYNTYMIFEGLKNSYMLYKTTGKLP